MDVTQSSERGQSPPDNKWMRALYAENECLRAALKPFADYAERIDGHYTSKGYPGSCAVGLKPDIDGTKEIVHLSDLRRARDVLQQTGAKT